MIAIKDRQSTDGVFPIARFLVAVSRHAEVPSNTIVQLTRFGGKQKGGKQKGVSVKQKGVRNRLLMSSKKVSGTVY